MAKKMDLCLKLLCVLFLGGLLLTPLSMAQSRAASATPVSPSTGRASSFVIRQDILAMKQADIERQIDEARRCIQDASNATILRDPEGNINRVPQTDLVNCSRRLAQLQRQLEGLAREANQLSVDAEFQAAQIQRRLQRERSRLTIQQLRSGGSSSAFSSE
ncbi:MAG: hypothetical protein HY913_23040 [Desulfomonile tiedjei]|nr:hypothetical protein [Desulfomonile tiedjei]